MKYLLFLDYDGTLTPIVKKPHLATLSKSRRSFLNKLCQDPRFMVTIISGRMLADLKKRVGLRTAYYAGNHGFEIIGPKTKLTHPKALAAKPILKKIKKELHQTLKGIKGALIEDKILTLSLHYRLVKAKDLRKVKTIFKNIVSPYLKKKKIRVTQGKKVFEVRPNVAWHKGYAVSWFIKKLGKGKKILPIYIGDDTTDEDAFKVLKRQGITVRVGKTKKTQAKDFVKNVDEVYKLLESMLKLPQVQ